VSGGRIPSGRATIADVARQAGVSKGAVSYALNNRDGVSEATRRRILSVADELGWYPNSAARALSAARADAWGLVVARSMSSLRAEHYYMELIAGIESVMSPSSISLHFQVADCIDEEINIYRRWLAEQRVDGVLVVDLRVDDPRMSMLRRIGLPALIIGSPDPTGRFPAVWTDESSSMTEVVRYLAALGHRRIARVGGIPELLHVKNRADAFSRSCQQSEIEPVAISTDFTPNSGARATRKLLCLHEPPTAIVYDSDVLAIAGLAVTREIGLTIPESLSIVARDGSPLCEAMYPALTTLDRDTFGFGAHAATQALKLLARGTVRDSEFSHGRLAPRSSTGISGGGHPGETLRHS
jgi:DNA-binding LacI/PurR family transcriptional regulator